MSEEFKYVEQKKVELAWWQRVFQFAMPLVIIGLAVLIAKKIIDGKVKPKRVARAEMTARARVITVTQQNEPVEITIMGTVVPAETLSLRARVTGQVTEVNSNLENGMQLTAGSWAVKLDPTDYQLAVDRASIQQKKVETDLQLEKGRQAVAKQEFELFDKKDSVSELDKGLALRQPQLMLAQANLELAANDLAMSKLKLERCVVAIPFDALVKEKIASPGMQLGTQQTIAELIRSDYFYIEASIPVSELAWLNLDDPDSSHATIMYNSDRSTRKGRVLRVLSSLEPQGRMARLLIAVDKPLDSTQAAGQKLPLLLGTYVRITLQGRTMTSAFKVPREALRDGDRLWLAEPTEPGGKGDSDDGHILGIRPVTITWKSRTHIFIRDGLNSGDLIIVSNLPAAVEGMQLKLASVDGAVVSASEATDEQAKPAPDEQAKPAPDEQAKPAPMEQETE